MTVEQPERESRPSPEALLRQIGRESRGRLKIFLGAAPGVGKTYAMLQTAQAKRREGADVVVGIAETHDRKETQALIRDLEIVPRQRVEYKGRLLEEMDLDAILKRRPKLAIVDELAHTNAPGSRHPKRYMDVEELLSAGIDVYTTLNVQHVESLNDVVAKITRIRVRETVPDSIVDQADDIELVDLTPEDLIQRLKEGKVYLPQQAERAVRNYFQPGNLTALRELALRRTAQRVDEQMVTYMRAHAISGPWAAAERVLVCINEDLGCVAVVRHARRLADRLRAPWTAIHVETSRAQRLTDGDKDRIADCLRLAQRLGGEAITVPGPDVATSVVEYAEVNNITHIIIAKSRRSRWSEGLRGSVTHQLIRRAGDISVHVIAEPGKQDKPQAERFERAAQKRPGLNMRAYAGTSGIVAAALGIGLVLQQFLSISNMALVFLTAVLVSAVAYGLWPSLFACLASVLAYNFFFLPPLYTFTVADPENVVALFFFALVAVIASNLTSRMRAQAITARQRARTTEELYLFTRKLAGAITLDDLLWATAYQIASMLRVRVVLLLPEGETIVVRAGYPPEDILDDADLAAAKWCWENNRPAGRDADTLPGAKRLFLPMRTGSGTVAVVGLDSDRPGPLLTPDRQRLLDALTDQAALAIERIVLAQNVDRARLEAETERLRSALLTSISHDLRTPLASIFGSATTLKNYRKELDDAAQEELIGTIQEESDRLNRFIANLLDMTRLESGAIIPRAELVDVGDVIGSALERAKKFLSAHKVKIDLHRPLPLLRIDPVLFEQVLFNLLDNASKYAQPGSTILVQAKHEGNVLHLHIIDEGSGIPLADLDRIFDKFYRIQSADRQRAGTGLGLAICHGFVEAMGGSIVAANRADRSGAIFTVTMPVAVTDAICQDVLA
ncbi:MAG: sensor histidine kinase KdpD [Beijerinckiaceae bacterium]|nr:MAG: sensor histidine kinase KdpD [Beijerinckiaceae bacterium]